MKRLALLTLRTICITLATAGASRHTQAQPIGACCYPSGGCARITAAVCSAVNGTYNGDGTTCGNCPQPVRSGCCVDNYQFESGCFPNETSVECTDLGGYLTPSSDCSGATPTCVSSRGRCCLTDVPTNPVCSNIVLAYCLSRGGVYNGAGSTSCANCNLVGPFGACCTAGGCQSTNAARCAALGGTYRGDSTQCGTNCNAFLGTHGACCFQLAGVCSDLYNHAQCTAAGGDYHGDNTTCASSPCATTGSCCMTSGSCVDGTTSTQCQTAGGFWYGSLTCAYTYCQQFGACCYPSGQCLDHMSHYNCESKNTPGYWHGPGTTCAAANPCPQPSYGACCDANGFCKQRPESACISSGGTFAGNAVPCTTIDLNADGRTDTIDLGIFLSHFGQTVPPGTSGDFNSDGIVNTIDFGLFLNHFGVCP